MKTKWINKSKKVHDYAIKQHFLENEIYLELDELVNNIDLNNLTQSDYQGILQAKAIKIIQIIERSK